MLMAAIVMRLEQPEKRGGGICLLNNANGAADVILSSSWTANVWVPTVCYRMSKLGVWLI